VALADLTSIDEVARSLDRLALPAQVAAVLDSRWLQHLVAVAPDRTLGRRGLPLRAHGLTAGVGGWVRIGSTVLRLSHWLTHALDELQSGVDHTKDTDAQLAHLMGRLLAFTNLVQARLRRHPRPMHSVSGL
jgi:hypothetical protein